MKKWLAAFLTLILLTRSLVVPGIAHAQTVPQATSVSQTSPCTDAAYASAHPDECSTTVGGVTLTPDDIIQAINAPTPNLANTTAYVFYTMSVLINGTFDPSREDIRQDGNPSQTTYYPESLGHALNSQGAIGGVAFLMGEIVSNKPASAQTYVADVIENSRFGYQPAYAQGIGFAALSPVLGTWKAFRDVAYYLLTVMFLVTGFLILIRHKISGNVAVTVQNALPRLVMTLIIITFSYAIAGFVVDLMFLILNFIVNIFESQIFQAGQINPAIGSVRNLAFNTHLFSFMLNFIFGTPGSNESNAWMASRALGNIVFDAITSAAGLSEAFQNGGFFNTLFSNILGIIFAIIFGIALLIAMFRVFFSLLMSYAGFVINVVLSPLILLQGAIPGRDPFKDWIKNLLAGLAPFVVTVFMILMSLALTGSNTRAGIGYNRSNPADSGLRLPLIMSGQIPAEAFLGILGMGFMLLLPEAVNISKKMVGAKGGPFDELKDKAVGNFQKGWSGNKYVPGAKNVMAGGAAGAATLGGAGAIAGSRAGSQVAARFGGGARAQKIGSVIGGFTGAIGGATAGGTLGAPAAFVGAPMYNLGKNVQKTVKPYVEGADTALTKVRNLQDQRQGRNSNINADTLNGGGTVPTTGGGQAPLEDKE